MLHRSKSKERASLPGPTFMSKEQMGDYLQDLRANRPSRPTGARPPPATFASKRQSMTNMSSIRSRVVDPVEALSLPRSSSAQGFRKPPPRPEYTTFTSDPHAGRPLARAPTDTATEDDAAAYELEEIPIPYIERPERWLERHEAHKLRQALQDVDEKTEHRVHTAAQQEASELVWKHQNPASAYQNPDAPYDYREHLRRESRGQVRAHSHSHSRTSSTARVPVPAGLQNRTGKVRGNDSSSSSRSVSGASKTTSASGSVRVPSDSSLKVPESGDDLQGKSGGQGQQQRKRSVQFAEPATDVPRAKDESRKTSMTSTSSGSTTATTTTKEIKDKEVKDKEIKVSNIAIAARMASNAVPHHLRNPFSRLRSTKGTSIRPSPSTTASGTPLHRIEIQRNPPTQSRNPAYTRNSPTEPAPAPPEDVKMKDGKEVRSDDIRKATSMSLRDRSAKLPTPVMVSDNPGRPIVSFDPGWRPREVELKEEVSRAPTPSRALPAVPGVGNAAARPVSVPAVAPPTIAVEDRSTVPTANQDRTRVPIPSIAVNDAPSVSGGRPPVPTISIGAPPVPSTSLGFPPVPSISVNAAPSISVNPPIPTIAVNDTPSISVTPSIAVTPSTSNTPNSSRPLPTPGPRKSWGATNKPHITPHALRSPGLCAACALPISGRIVGAAGARFHPECFRCHHCGEGLECVAFYPEPEGAREARIARINARLRGEEVPGEEGEDGDEGLRFYCHLDFHEFFSPRCKSCKTPIEGEVVVACGAEWHVGHFFCAQCGDPFDAQTPFVEKEGYAWCVGCHTHRYSAKCAKCRKPVTEMVVRALGREWHEGCFCCVECKGPFSDGRYFLRPGRETEPFCPGCEERRLKA
ncbi:hypothetical protein EJ06DRAFT_529639 [Trichodelitschia bisporula]|uniref:LIM zinc-binding domain-containing protein n=1 Tax=Trichodelitschia bisporula TaxID=703511 RepID=A0A6G1HZP7_9PEZI|nr:hypothetical protein EJ06DRAFT_529639 [Trichodelitschia bisporula]